MKKSLLFLLLHLSAIIAVGQPLTGTKSVPGDYATITAAVADLNIKGVGTGGVIFNIAAGFTETITTPISLTATGTALSPIIFRMIDFGPNPLITAYVGTATPSSAIQDGIWKLVGSDYVTIDHINLLDPNTTNPATMEYGFGLFKKAANDGCQHNCIKNCVVTLNRINNATGTHADMHGSKAINMINTLDNSQNITMIPANAAGTNSYNQFYYNTLQNCNIGIALYGYDAPAPFTLGDTGNDIGGTSVATGNYVLNFGGAPSATNSTAGIRVNNQWGINISYNTVNNNNGSGVNHAQLMYGIYGQSGTSAGATINHNNLTMHGGGTTANVYGIFNGIGSTPSNETVVISHNTIIGSYLSATTGFYSAIRNNSTAAMLNITDNTVSGITMSGTGTLWGISVGDATNVMLSGNSVMNLTKTGAGTLYGIQPGNASIVALNNSINGLFSTAASGVVNIYGICSYDSPLSETYTANTVKNLRSVISATITGVYIAANTGEKTVNGNACYSFTLTGGGAVYGININATGVNAISENQIHDLMVTGTISGDVYGLMTGNATIQNIFSNQIYALSCAGGNNGNMNGLRINGGTTNNVYKNQVYNLSSGSTQPAVNGICFTGGGTNNLYNNYLSDLRTTQANTALPIAGISITGGTITNVFNNTVYLSGTSIGALFGSAALYAETSTTLDMRNNILVNVSTPKGDGVVSAYRRGSATLSTYSTTSNSNCYYAGILQDNTHAIFYDGTTPYNFAAFQTLVGPVRDNHSFRELPPFISTMASPNNLHLQVSVPTNCESYGSQVTTPISISDDFDGDIRQGQPGYAGTGIAPDVGADEFDGIPDFSCNIPSPLNTVASDSNICYGQTITLSLQGPPVGIGFSYQWQSSSGGILFSDIPEAVFSTYTITPQSAMYYRCVVFCLNGPVTDTSAPLHIQFNNNILSTTPGNICGPGPVQLAATCNSGATIKWYTAPSGGTAIGTGSPFTTPALSSTTGYYVAAETFPPTAVALGNGSLLFTEYANPFYYFYGGQKNQFLIKASELTASGLVAGNLTALSFDVASSYGTTYQEFNISIGHTALNNLTTTFQTGLTNVFSTTSPAGVTPTTGIFTINFTTPFAWDGVSNIIVQTCWSNNNYGNIYASAILRGDATTFIASGAFWADNTTPPVICANNNCYYRYNQRIKMLIRGISRCASPRQEVVATIKPIPALALNGDQTVCNNGVATLQVTSTLSNFSSYAWTPATYLFQDAACTAPYVAGSSKTTVYAKTSTPGNLVYTCTGTGSANGCPNTATATVTMLPANPPIMAQFDPICQSGSTQLSISPSDPYGTAAFQWQTSSNNVTFTDIAGATNTSYITPVISTTTWYRLKLMNGGNQCTQSSYSVVVRHPQITGVTPGYHCGEGTVTLGATASDGIPAWYAASTGGTSLGTGNSFTTPSLSSTTGYYVGALTNATATVQVGNGSATSGVFESPFDYYAGGVKNQYLIMATDLLNAGLIAGNLTALAFDVVSSDGTTFQGFNLSIGQTLQSSLYIDFLTGLTNVYSTTAPAGVTPVNGIFTINFSTPFAWDGTSNIVVETCWSNNNTGAPASGAMVKNDLTSYLSHIKIGLNNENPSDVCSFLYAPSHGIDCPKMIFTENTQCESTRTPVVATIHTPVQVVPAILPANVCAAHPTALSVANVTPGYSYSWNPGNLSGAAQTVYPDTTTAYTVTATLTGTTCTTSAPVTATVLNSPATITITPATSVISPGAIQPLTATGGQVTNAVILSENFNGVTNNWTTINNSAGGNVSAAAWTLRPNNYYYAGSQTVTFNSNDNSQFYLTNSDAQGAGSITSTILQSPVFSTVGYISGQVSFFHHFMEYPGSYGNVEASTNGTTWTTLQTYTAMAGSVNGFTGATVPLTTPFLNQPAVYVRFLFYGEWAWWWAIDNVTITGTEQVGKVVWSPLTALYTDAAATIPYTGAQLSTVYSKPAATITYTATAVNPANGCDRSANATVSIQSAIPPIIYVVGVNIGSGQNLCYNATSTITVTDFNVQGGGIATFIAGEKIILIPETRVFPAGYLHAKIAPAGPFCSQTKMTEVIATGDIPSATEFAWFSLYPNPTNGNFTLVQKGDRAFSNIRVEVYSTRGEKILTESMIGEKDHEFRFSEMPPAMYFVKVVADDYVETIKLVKTR